MSFRRLDKNWRENQKLKGSYKEMTTMRNTHKKDEYLKDMKNRLSWYNIYLIKTLEDYRKSEVEAKLVGNTNAQIQKA